MADTVNEEVPEKRARTAFYYGDEELSDVVLIVDDSEFHVHRSYLFTRSTYFKELFAPYPPEGKIFISIKEDIFDFKFMINMMYNQFYGEDDEPSRCQAASMAQFNEEAGKEVVRNVWLWLDRDMRIAERFKVVDVVHPILDHYVALYNCELPTCAQCAARSLLALFHNWKHVISRMKTSVDTLTLVLTFLSNDPAVDLPVFHIAPAAFSKILDGILGGVQEKLDVVKENESSVFEEAAELQVFKYGRANVLASNVVLFMENTEFHVHKHFLALNSPVFTAMFFTEFEEKTAECLPINHDITAFKGVMDILYNGQIEDKMPFLVCNAEDSQKNIMRFWDRLPPIMQLFDYYDLPYRSIEDVLRWCGNVGCIQCANKKIFSMHYNLQKAKDKIHCDPMAIVDCLRKFQDVLPNPLHLIPAEMCDLIKTAKAL